MNPVKLALNGLQKFNDQFADLSTEVSASNTVPTILTADTTLVGDYSKYEIDATGGDITITLIDATQIDEFAWQLHRTDGSSNRVFIVPADVTQLINGQTSWELFPYENLQFTAELSQYTVK